MAVSTKAFAYYDDDISIAEYCDDELARSYGPEYNDIFFDVAGEAELRTDFFGNEYWYLVNNDAVCYVTFKENGYLDKVEVFFAD
jgi:hypothetical protein